MTRMVRHLSLVLPDLSAVITTQSQAQRWPALEILLARSERETCPAELDTLLFLLFGVNLPAGHTPPVAAVTHALDTGDSSTAWLLRADPVYLRADNDRVLMIGNEFLSISQAEASALGEELSPLFDDFAAHLSTPQGKRWYLELPRDPEVQWRALSEVRGMDIHHYLPADWGKQANAKRWRRLFNEVQMSLYTSPVNAAREARGELPVNSLWFWGGGRTPEIPKHSYSQIWSDSPCVLGLARLGGIPRTGAPASAATWLAQAITPGKHLLVLEREAPPALAPPSFGNDPATTLETLTQHWFAPLLAALKSGELSSLNLYTGAGQVFRCSTSSTQRWWKRPRRLAGVFS